jgi:hypothetical protein
MSVLEVHPRYCSGKQTVFRKMNVPTSGFIFPTEVL